MAKKILWTICDDSEGVRFVYSKKLSKYDDLEFVGGCATGAELMELLETKKADVVLLDIQLEYEKEGLELIEKVKEKAPDVKILILTSYDNDEYIFEAFASGVEGYIKKDEPIEKMHDNIVNAYNRHMSIPSDIVNVIANKAKKAQTTQKSLLYVIEILSRLSVSEYEVLREYYNGKTYKEIAKLRFVDTSTVKVQAYNIIKKFNAASMKDLIKTLTEMKVFDIYDRD